MIHTICVIIVRVRSGQEEHTEKIHLSDFKTVMLHFSSYELYIYFQVFIINVDILFIHDAYYMSAIIVRVRSGQEGVSKYD
jgi:hypothetical protein